MSANFIIPKGCAPDDCEFQRVEIGDEYEDPSGILVAGMEVMLPCEKCGLTANEYMEWMDKELEQHQQSAKLIFQHKNVPLFHWSPAKYCNSISKLGLLPDRRPTTHAEFRAPYICFSDDPVWAWALSGLIPGTPDGEWDLWQTWFNDLTEPEILMNPDIEGNGVHEVRTHHRVYKRNLKYIGSRTKPLNPVGK